MHRTIYDSFFAKATLNEGLIKNAIKFVMDNKSMVVMRENDLKVITTMVSSAKTPVSLFFEQIQDNLDEFLFLDFTNVKNLNLPEIFSHSTLPLDPRPIVKNLPEDIDTIWLNTTTHISHGNTREDPVRVTDIFTLQSLICKAFLHKSYDISDGPWLTPELASILIRVYTMTISQDIIKKFNIGLLQDKTIVKTVIALMFAQKFYKSFDDSKHDYKLPQGIYQIKELGNRVEIKENIDEIYEILGDDVKELNVEHVCKYLRHKFPQRMRQFSERIYIQIFLSFTGNKTQLDGIAMDYPPYWAHMLIECISGKVNKLSYAIKNMKLKEDLTKFTINFLRNKEVMYGD